MAGNGDGHVGQRAWRLADELIFRLERGGQADDQIVPVSVTVAAHCPPGMIERFLPSPADRRSIGCPFNHRCWILFPNYFRDCQETDAYYCIEAASLRPLGQAVPG